MPDVKICAEIPFVDGPEGVCTTTISRKHEIIPPAQFAEQRPTFIMVPAASWSEIKKTWLAACRKYATDCAVQVESVDSVVRKLDALVKSALGPK